MPLNVDDYRPTIEVRGLSATAALWSAPYSKWGDSLTRWSDPGANVWHSVACQVAAFTSSWGADEGTGVLAQSAAGVLTLETYDPDRILDPSNLNSPLRNALRITAPVRLVIAGAGVVAYGYLDELTYRYEDQGGTLTAADDVATLAQAETSRDFWQPVNSLVAFASAAIANAGQTVPVGAAPAAGDPVIAYSDTRGKAVWSLIRDAALDALCYLWLDRQTDPPTLRVSPFGAAVASSLVIGDGGIELGGLVAVESAAGVMNVVDDATGELARAPMSTGREQAFTIDRVEPAGRSWGEAIIADRASATVSLVPGEVRPSTLAQLAQLVTARGMDAARLVLLTQPIDATVRVAGVKLQGEAGGIYRATLAVYSPGSPWSYLPPPPASVAATPSERTFNATKDSGLVFGGALAPGTNRNRGYGLGPMKVGREAGPFTYSALLAFDPMTWDGVRRVRRVELVLVYTAAGASGLAVEITRIVEPWTEGRIKSTDALTVMTSNAVVTPGPAVDPVIVPASLTATAAGAEQRIDITALAMVTLPVTLGGRGYPDFGYRIAPTLSSGNLTVTLEARESPDDEPTSTPYCRLEVAVEV